MKLRKLNRALHRDLGYLFFAMTVIYGLSGIALNHINDWNPNYVIRTKEINIEHTPLNHDQIDREKAIALLNEYASGEKYKNHYFPSDTQLKIFIKDGSITLNTQTGSGMIETSKRRAIFHQVNYLHYNPQKWWTIFSDIYAASLIILAMTGLFILKGKNGITGRGAWLTILGAIIPVLFLLLYYWKIF
ncbi:MAG: PepSY-associated TM helix domain-containing protein [Bacteroidales bacterium]